MTYSWWDGYTAPFDERRPGAALMAQDADTAYLGRIVSGTWTDVTGGVTAHTVVGGGINTCSTNVAGQAGLWCGDGDFVYSSAGGTDWKLTGDVTVEAVVRVETAVGTPYAVWCGGDAASSVANENAHYAIGWSSDTWRWVSESGSGTAATFSTPATFVSPNIGQWLHLAAVRESNVVKIYENGVLLATSGTLTTPTGGTNAALHIGGAVGSTAYYWDGYIRDVRISSRARTANEILSSARRSLGS